MLQLSQTELLTVTALDRNLLKQLQYRDQVALAFGRRHCYQSLGYVALDAAAIMLADTLAKTYGRDIAAQLVRVHCDKWAEAVALFEVDYKTGVFVVADFENDKGQAAHLTGATNTTDIEVIAKSIKRQPQVKGFQPTRVTIVNMAPLIRFIQKTAAAHGIDLLAPWVPKHGSPEFIGMFSPIAKARDTAITKVSERAVEKAGEAVRRKVEVSHEPAE